MYRINKLLKLKSELYHTGDLALIWEIKKSNTLYTTIKRYVKQGILTSIHKGFYSTVPVNNIDPIKLGLGYIHQLAYVSCEYVLVKSGIIFQKSSYITLVSSISKKFSIGKNSYLVRQLKDSCLYNDYGIETKDNIKTASAERAVADILYFNPNYYFDNRKKINWKKVRKIQKQVYL